MKNIKIIVSLVAIVTLIIGAGCATAAPAGKSSKTPTPATVAAATINAPTPTPAQATTPATSGTCTTVLIPNGNNPTGGATPDTVAFYPISTNGPIGMVAGRLVYIPNGSSKTVTLKFARVSGKGSVTLDIDPGESAEISLLPGQYTVTWTVPDSAVAGASTLTVDSEANDYVVGKGKSFAGIFTLANQR